MRHKGPLWWRRVRFAWDMFQFYPVFMKFANAWYNESDWRRDPTLFIHKEYLVVDWSHDEEDSEYRLCGTVQDAIAVMKRNMP